MATLRLPQFLKKYGIRLLPVSSKDVVPGLVLARERLTPITSLEYRLDGTTGVWPTTTVEGKIVDAFTWEEARDASGGLTIPGIVSITGGLAKGRSGVFKVSNTTLRMLDTATQPDLFELDLKHRLAQWRKQSENRTWWHRLDDHWFVQSAWFAEDFTLEFKTESGAEIDVQATVAAEVNVEAGATVNWTSESSLTVTGVKTVPFAVGVWRL